MAPPPDTANFELSTTFPDWEADQTTMSMMMAECWINDAIFSLVMKDVSVEDRVAWFKPTYSNPSVRFFAIREKASGKIVAFTNLSYPMTLTVEQQAAKEKLDEEVKQPPPGANKEAFDVFNSYLGQTKKFGYDSTKHFHRKGLFTDPAYQRRGFGTWLTKHTNAIADEYGQPTFVGARPASKHLFESVGFQVIGSMTVDPDELWWSRDGYTCRHEEEYDGLIGDSSGTE